MKYDGSQSGVRGPESESKSAESQRAASESGIRNDPRTSAELLGQFSGFAPRTSDAGRRTVLWALVVAGLLGLYPLQRSLDDWKRSAQGHDETLVFLPSETKLGRISGGYAGLLADIYWTRVVQYYGRHRLARAQKFPLLGTLLDITTSLDPHLLVAYRFGSVFLAGRPPEGAGDPKAAIHLLERGIVNNPGYWRLWEDLGFIYYWDMKDYARAARAFQAGSERPGALPWMRALAATVAAKGGDINTSRLLWLELVRNAGNDAVRHSAEMHLAALNTLQALDALNTLLDRYRQQQGRPAASLQDLVNAGYLRGIPLDPTGVPFVVGPTGRAALGPKSRVDLNLVI